MYAMRSLPSKRCLRLVWGVEHSLPSGCLASAGAPTSALPAARFGSCELLSADPGVAPPEGHPGHGRLKGTARAAVRHRGGGLGRLLAPRGAGGARWFPPAPPRAGACTSRPGRSHDWSRRRAGRSRTADMELRVALGLALLCSALEAAPAAPQRPRSAVGQFWHVSDLHLDPTYHITPDRTKVCSSSKGVNASNPGPFGDFLCDSPYQLILSAFEFMNNSKEQVSFMIWTGDSPPHVHVKELSTKLVISIIGNLSSTIRNFFPDLQVFPALGNHDYWPQDQLPVTTSEVYNAVADFWKPWLSDEAINTFRKGGFYTQLFESSNSHQPLRIISLNTNLYYSPNKVTVNITDPANQFAWLEEILETSSQKKEKVYIIGHVPVGYLPYARNTTAIREYYNERLVKIFRKYSSVIAGQFFGHTHRDSIMVLLDEEEKPVNSLFVAPAVTPVKSVLQTESNNPGVRLYQYDLFDYSLLDLWQFYLDLRDANKKNESNWTLEYILTKTYSIEDLKPQSLYEMAKQLSMPHSTLFEQYYSNYIVSYDKTIRCEEGCKTCQICAIQYLDYSSYTDCINQEAVWR
ncbi:acid sphingomyelinase-like phosphodiesterase 3a isoform X1 [Vidua chalybeata]|uniref:acid sphingomyelinase-like phosphodiesterase 3a isoform X1 n=1 Tax=Vidua chalybeata TaxID=81927 RepID=UPI0023A8AE5A|nr:acid sphingomyelinase-like phosphodiesterase 3a isoform X1 [Vidua chalybeata]